MCLFVGAHGYDIKQKILFQDNHSAINMKKMGRSCALGTLGTSIYVISLLRTGLKATTFQLHTAEQSTYLQI